MKKCSILLLAMLISSYINAQKATLPTAYEKENTGATCKPPRLPNFEQLPISKSLPNPLAWENKRGVVTKFKDWKKRRAEIAYEIQHYEIGEKPAVDLKDVHPRMNGDTLVVDVTVNGQTLTLSSLITYPKTGKAPYPVMIGTSHISLPSALFEGRGIALMTFHEKQVNDYSQFGKHGQRGQFDFDRLYPHLSSNGAYSEWAWGLSRLIDGLQILGSKITRIDTRHIGVTGCSYTGKMALFCGAFDERVALTIPQEPGGGGAAAWRVSHTLTEVESQERTDYNWFLQSFRTGFSGDSIYRLPYDRHELVAMIFPRAVLLLGNPDYRWLADESMYVSANAALKVWEHFGVPDRFGYSIIANHPHCQLPESQYAEVEAYLDKFLLGKQDANTLIRKAPMFQNKVDLAPWIDF